MDIYRLTTDLKFVNQLGATLHVEERMKLEIALLRLNETEKFEQILFWGKIEGTEKDYYIALGLNFKGQYEFPIKKFFWSSNDFKFAELPAVNPEYKDKVGTFRQPFIGKAEEVLISVTGENEEEPAQQEPPKEDEEPKERDPLADTDDETEVKVPPKNFTELDRLAYTVRAIDIDCASLPVGALKLSPLHELRYNDSFKGLNTGEAADLSNYQHFRNPLTSEKQEFITRGDAIFHLNFLDPLYQDVPKGCWSIHTDSSKTQVTVRSLLWPGYITYHQANTNIYGFAYFGNGVKNSDLPFLI